MLELFWVPFAAAVLLFVYPNRRLAILLSCIPLVLLLIRHQHLVGLEVNEPWLSALSINFHLRIDPLSVIFLYLTAIIVPISLLSERSRVSFPNLYYGFVLLLQGLLIGFFTARDLVVFAVFWEAMLLPLYFIITAWGGHKRHHAAFTFLIYMIAGSALMVAAVLGLYFTANTFDIDKLSSAHAAKDWIFAIFLLAFAVKTPLFPFHGWLPEAYTQAPRSGTILLSAILSKAGVYGILLIGIGIFPTQMVTYSPILLALAIAGVFYGGFAAWGENDFKRLIAYSSLSHVNFILVGLFVWSQAAHSGAILQALNHGITIAALFMVAGWLEDRLESTSMMHASGLTKYFPYLGWLTMFFVLSSVALPGMNNFVGEVFILFGLFTKHPWATAILALTVVLSVVYMLRWMQIMYFQIPSTIRPGWVDIQLKQLCIAAPLVVLILWLGLYPAPVLKQIEKATIQLGEKAS